MSKFKVGDIVTPVKDHGPLKLDALYRIYRIYEQDYVDYIDVVPLEGGLKRGGYFPERFRVFEENHDDLYI